MKKIFSFGLPFVSCVVAVFFLLPSCGDNEEIVQRKSEKSYSVDEGKNQLVVEIPCRRDTLPQSMVSFRCCRVVCTHDDRGEGKNLYYGEYRSQRGGGIA